MAEDTRLTIDRMGGRTSSRYARDQAALDTQFIKDSRFIPQKIEISVVEPYRHQGTEFEDYLHPSKVRSWAFFAPPPEYEGTSPLFSFELIPSLGGYEKQEAAADKLEAWAEGKSSQEERERKTLIGLLKMINSLDRTLTLINSRRNQYQRG